MSVAIRGKVSFGNAEAYRRAVMADSPVGYWRLGEVTGTVAKDEMGAYDGVYSGTYNQNRSGAILGNACVGFTGAAGLVTVSSLQNVFAGLQKASLEGWMRRDVIGRTVNFGFYTSNNNRFYLQWSGDIIYGSASTGSALYKASSVLAVTTWVYAVIVFDGSLSTGRINLYINGSSVGGTSGPTVLTTKELLGDFRISGAYSNSYGYIDEVALYNTALTSQQVANHYAVAAMTTGGRIIIP